MLLSIALLLFRMMRPRISAIGGVVGNELRDTEGLLPPALPPKLAALRFDRSLFFVNASFFEEALIELERNNPQLEYILVIASGINFVDIAGAELFANEAQRRRRMGGDLHFYRMKDSARHFLERGGYMDIIGKGVNDIKLVKMRCGEFHRALPGDIYTVHFTYFLRIMVRGLAYMIRFLFISNF